MNKHKKFLERTIELASKNVKNKGGGPFAAILVKNDEIIYEGTNSVTTKFDPSAHAEIETIRLATKDLQDVDLSKYTLYSSCRPCPMCLGAIYWSNIKEVYYAADSDDAEQADFRDKYIYDEFKKEESKRLIKLKQIKIKSRKKPFLNWLNSENIVKY